MYCKKCGKENKTETKFCTNCGNSIDVSSNYVVKEEKSTFGWGILGFLFPIVGLVLLILWRRKNKPKASKSLGIGTLIKLIIIYIFILLIVLSSLIPFLFKSFFTVLLDSDILWFNYEDYKYSWYTEIGDIEDDIEEGYRNKDTTGFDLSKICTKKENIDISETITTSNNSTKIVCDGPSTILVIPNPSRDLKAIKIKCKKGVCTDDWNKKYR